MGGAFQFFADRAFYFGEFLHEVQFGVEPSGGIYDDDVVDRPGQ